MVPHTQRLAQESKEGALPAQLPLLDLLLSVPHEMLEPIKKHKI